ncbi:DnaJ domain-containing protein, partial [Dimargaris cristalligena]
SYYDHLQITPQASKQDIKKAFYKLSMKYHPDRNHGDSSAHSQFIQINEAYDTLGGELKRREYDRKL